MTFNQSLPVNKTILLNNQLELWRYILGLNVDIGEYFCSPFRKDTRPGACLDQVGDYIRLRDYGDPIRHQKDIFSLVMQERACDFDQAVRFLISKTNIDFSKTHVKKNKTNKRFLIKSFPVINQKKQVIYTQDHIDFWKPLDIVSDQLLTDLVFPIQAYKSGYGKLSRTVIPQDITFSIFFKGSRHQKLYRPLRSDKDKWLTNCNELDIGFWGKIDYSQSYLVITKSYKDCKILRNLGYNAIWLQSESTYIPDNYVKYLEKKFDKIFLLFDNDEEGINWVLKHQEKYNNLTQSLKFIPQWYSTDLPKDTAELYRDYSKSKVIKELKNMI